MKGTTFMSIWNLNCFRKKQLQDCLQLPPPFMTTEEKDQLRQQKQQKQRPKQQQQMQQHIGPLRRGYVCWGLGSFSEEPKPLVPAAINIGGDFDNGGVIMLVRVHLPSPYDRSSSTSLTLEMLGVQ
jgi:hypothetical protein